MSRWFDPTAPLPPDATVAPVRHIYRRIFAYMLEFRAGVGWGVGLAMVSSLFVTLQPWPIKFIIDGVLRQAADGASRLDLGQAQRLQVLLEHHLAGVDGRPQPGRVTSDSLRTGLRRHCSLPIENSDDTARSRGCCVGLSGCL